MSLSSLRAVSITTGMALKAASAFMRRSTSKPSAPGIMASSTTRSGRSRVIVLRASSPSPAVITR
jgi:hypothetical protein